MNHAETQALKANLRREASVRRKQAHAAHPQAGLALLQHFKNAIQTPAGAAISEGAALKDCHMCPSRARGECEWRKKPKAPK